MQAKERPWRYLLHAMRCKESCPVPRTDECLNRAGGHKLTILSRWQYLRYMRTGRYNLFRTISH